MKELKESIIKIHPYIIFTILVSLYIIVKFFNIPRIFYNIIEILWIYVLITSVYDILDQEIKSTIKINKIKLFILLEIIFKLLFDFRLDLNTVGLGSLPLTIFTGLPYVIVNLYIRSLIANILTIKENNQKNRLYVFLSFIIMPISSFIIQKRVQTILLEKK